MDASSGYEAIADQFLQHRSSTIGVQQVKNWARMLPPGSSVIDVGCGSGFPLTLVLVDEGLDVFAVDGAPAMVTAFRRTLPGIPILCEALQKSDFYQRSFDTVLAWGVMFLLKAEDQRTLIQRLAELLVSRGRLLFTSPAVATVWRDAATGRQSVSLGAQQYRLLLDSVGISVESEFLDQGNNYYFNAYKR